jgi:hypothetical protein
MLNFRRAIAQLCRSTGKAVAVTSRCFIIARYISRKGELRAIEEA